MKAPILISLTLLYLMAAFTAAKAQFGVKAGVGASDIIFRDKGQTPYLGYEINSIEHNLPLLTYQIGAFASFEVSEHFNFQPEILFITQGLDYSTKFLYDEIKYKIRISYLQFPLLFKYNTALKKDKFSGFIAGPYASIRIKANLITEIGGQREKWEVTNVKQTDFGLIAGYAFDFNIAARKVLIDLRAGYSLFNMMDRVDGYKPIYGGPEKKYARNASITLSVQYQFANDKTININTEQ